MDEKTLCNLSIRELAGLLRKRELSSAEVTRQMLNRIRRLNPSLRAYITVLEESALEAAAQADKEIVAGKLRGPLHGVPVAVKDLCFTKGIRTTCSSSVLRDWRPDSTATVVMRLESAGAVILGKLNLTEFAVAWYSPEFPPPLIRGIRNCGREDRRAAPASPPVPDCASARLAPTQEGRSVSPPPLAESSD
jgi:amidase